VLQQRDLYAAELGSLREELRLQKEAAGDATGALAAARATEAALAKADDEVLSMMQVPQPYI
jgi:hypothetical protein